MFRIKCLFLFVALYASRSFVDAETHQRDLKGNRYATRDDDHAKEAPEKDAEGNGDVEAWTVSTIPVPEHKKSPCPTSVPTSSPNDTVTPDSEPESTSTSTTTASTTTASTTTASTTTASTTTVAPMTTTETTTTVAPTTTTETTTTTVAPTTTTETTTTTVAPTTTTETTTTTVAPTTTTETATTVAPTTTTETTTTVAPTTTTETTTTTIAPTTTTTTTTEITTMAVAPTATTEIPTTTDAPTTATETTTTIVVPTTMTAEPTTTTVTPTTPPTSTDAAATVTPTTATETTIAVTTTAANTQSTDGCQTNDDGSFGVTNTDDVNSEVIKYSYELELNSSSTASMSAIIPPIEEKINDALLPMLFPGLCTERRALLALRDARLPEQRRLEVLGISPKPGDLEVTDESCISRLYDEANSCKVMNGGLTLYATSQEDTSELKETILDAIKAGMEENEFTSVHPDIVKLHYIEEVTEEANAFETVRAAGSDEIANGGSPTSMLVAAAAATVAVIGAIIGWRKLRKNDDEDEDSEDDSETDLGGSRTDANYRSNDQMMEEGDMDVL